VHLKVTFSQKKTLNIYKKKIKKRSK